MQLPSHYALRCAEHPADFASFAQLALAYQAWLGVDLGFQAFERELQSLPGCYAAPGGFVLLISHAPRGGQQDAQDVACVAVRPLHTNSTAHAASSSSCHGGGGGGAAGSSSGGSPDSATGWPSRGPPPLAEPQPPGADHRYNQRGGGDSNRPLDPAVACEMKRLWVAPDHARHGLGRALVAAAVDRARLAGYKHVLLDTLESLTAANRLYAGAGFARRAAYYHNPLGGVVYWQLDL